MSITHQFLSHLSGLVRYQNGDELRAWLQVLPSSPQQYHNLAAELRTQFPAGSDSDARLEAAVERDLPEEDVPDGQATSWPGFISFVKDYLIFWRDVDYGDLVTAHSLLSGLVNVCSTAFANPTYGGMLLQTSMSLSEALSQLTMMLNKRPDLTMGRRLDTGGDDERKSVAEMSAEIIQKIFTTCLTDRSSARNGRPEGKKVGVYMFANLVLRLLFACRKAHLANQIFTNISTNSLPLKLYPAAQRVTFLYYLGRFNLSNNHYHRAAACLEEAYLETPPQLVSHRKRILTYLIPSNLFMGRLPTQALLQRPEAETLAPVFAPLAASIRTGNFVLFQHSLAAHEPWLLDKGLLIPLTHRLRPFLWRSLSRRVFMLTYVPAPDDVNSRKAAVLDLSHLHVAATFLQHFLEGYVPAPPTAGPRPHLRLPPGAGVSPMFIKALRNSAAEAEAASDHSTLEPPAGGPRRLRPNEGLVWGNADVTMQDVEMVVLSLIDQGLLHGFVAHSAGKFAIMGGKVRGGPLAAGWPCVAQAIRERTYPNGAEVDWDSIPGWKKH